MYSNQGYVPDCKIETTHSVPTTIDVRSSIDCNLNRKTSTRNGNEINYIDPLSKIRTKRGVVQKQILKNIGLFLADQAFSGIIVGPLTVFYWWGAWNLLGRYIYPDNANFNAILCMAIGNCGLIFLGLSQKLWKKILPIENSWLAWLIGLHGYTLVCGLFNVCHWRGVWIILDYYTGINVNSYWITYVIGQSLLWFLKCSKSAQAPPMSVATDRTSSIFEYTVRFKTKPSFSLNFLYDVLFTVTVINQLVVFYWRGVWGMLDELFFKENEHMSTWAGFGIGYSLMLLLCFIQPLFNLLFGRLVRKQDSKSQESSNQTVRPPGTPTTSSPLPTAEKTDDDKTCVGTTRWFLEVILYLISNTVNVFIWRSVWRFCDEFMLPLNKDAGNAAGISIGLGILMILACGPSVTIRGSDEDGDEAIPTERVCFNPNFYFRQFYSDRTKIPFSIVYSC